MASCITLTGNNLILATEVADELGLKVPFIGAKLNSFINSKYEESAIEKGEYTLPTKAELINHINSTKHDYVSRTFVHNIEDVSAIDKVHKVYDPQTKIDRSNLIATLFSNVVDRAQAKNPLLTRQEVISKETPKGIFDQIKESFEKSITVEGVSEDRIREFKKVLDNFDALAELSTTYLKVTEGLKFNFDADKVKLANQSEDATDGGEYPVNTDDPGYKEDQIKDGWMINFRHLSANESLSQNVRRTIANLVKTGFDGEPEVDDLGFERHIPSDYAFATLMDKLKGMTKDTHLIPMLQQLAANHMWVHDILDMIIPEEGIKQSKEQLDLQSQFYQNFRKDFIPMWVQKPFIDKAGKVKYKTVQINATNGVAHLMESFRDNHESGTKLTVNSIYDEGGKLIKFNLDKNLATVDKLLKSYQSIELLEKDDVEIHNQQLSKWISDNIVELQDLAKSIGVDVNVDTLNQALSYKLYAGAELLKYAPTIEGYLSNLRGLFANLKPGELDEQGVEGRVDLGAQNKIYTSLATMLAKVTEHDIESSVHEAGKSYYSYLVPSYIGKLIKNLQMSHGNMADFKEFVLEQFDKYSWFKDPATGQYRSEWLRELTASGEKGEKARATLERKTLIHFDKIPYTDLTDKDYTIALLNEYFSDPTHKTAYFHVPILADAPSAEFIKFKKYINDASTPGGDYKEFLLDRFMEVAHQELDRITEVNLRKPLIAEGKVKKIDNIDDKGNRFQFFPELNEKLEEIQSLIASGEPLAGEKADKIIRDTIKNSIESSFEKRLKEWDEVGLFETNSKDDMTLKSLDTPNAKKLLRGEDGSIQGAVRTDLENYYWNSMFATSQIIQLSTTDLAYYKNIEDFQKRNKQIYAPATRLNTHSEYGREIERTVYLKDNNIISRHLTHIESILDNKIQKGDLTALDKAKIMASYGAANQWIMFKDGKTVSISEEEYNKVKNDKAVNAQKFYTVNVNGKIYKALSKEINETDAQAYRSLSSRRAVADMAGQWTAQMQKTYDNFKKGKWDMGDFDTVWNAEKPFLYTQTSVETGIDGKTWKVPTQNKNSETLLLMLGLMGASPELSALNEFMEKNNIDVVQFESAVKEGGQGKLDINNFKDKEAITTYLESKLKEPDVLHELNYEDYGIQNTVPEHLADAESLYGTQLRKLVVADLPDDPNFRLELDKPDGSKLSLTKKEALDLYNQLHVDNLMDSFKQVKATFGSNQEISKRLLEEVRGSKRFGIDMVRAVTLNEKGEFTIPLNEPSQALRVQSLLNSIIRNDITKQKMNGGSAVQVSSFGLSDDLNIVFEGEGENKKIKHFECYMPWYSKKYFEPLIDPVTGNLDVSKVPEELRKLIGYRIPTEDKYSMTPLYIKGFLPQQLGGAIMLPSEITTISGSDFDIDKLYLMIPNFKVTNKFARENTITDLVKDFKKTHPESTKAQRDELKNELNIITDQILSGEQFSANSKEQIVNDFLERNKNKFAIEPSIEKIQYDHEKGSQANTKEQRDNLLQDITRGILTHPDTASKILNPGGFDSLKSSARVVTLLDKVDYETLKSWEKAYQKRIGNSKITYYDYLKSLTLEEATQLADKYKKQLNMLDPRTQVLLHQRNMTAAKLIGMAANQSTNHALMQHTNLEWSKDTYYYDEEGNKKTINGGEFTLNGKKASSLHDVKAHDGSFISRSLAVNIGASVDAVKDPVLSDVNMNTFTFDIAAMLNRSKYNHDTVALLLQQPIIKRITTEYFNRAKEGDRKEDIINSIIDDYSKSQDPQITERYKKQQFLDSELAANIAVSKVAESMIEEERSHHSDLAIKSYYNNQVNVAYLFKHLMANADIISDLINATKADTSNGSAGPSNADTIEKMRKIDSYLESITPDSNDFSPEKRKRILLNNADVISNTLHTQESFEEFKKQREFEYEQQGVPIEDRKEITYNDALRQQLLDSQLPMSQAFYTLGLKSTEDLMGRMFPDFNPEFKDVITQMSAFTKSGKLDAKTINNITTDLYAYIMSGKRFLGGTNEEMRGKRDAFINKFIPEYNRIIANNSDIAKLDIIKALQVQKSTKDGSMDVLVSRSIGDLSQAKKEAITNSWTSLFYMSEEGQQLAMNLFQYAYYRNGFGFANNSFMHLAPTVIKEAAPEYLNTLRGLISQRISPENAKDYYQHFLLQYLRNHADNRRLVPNIDVHNTKVEFVDSQHEIKNEITITIDKNSTSEDRKFVSKINSQEIAWRPLISVNYKGGEELFVNDNYFDDSEAGRDTVTYTRVEPLGLKGNFLEYEFDTPHNEISSVIDRESLEIPKGRDTGKAILWEGGNNADYEEYIKNNPDLQAPSIGYEATERNDIAAKQAIEEQFGKHTLEDAPRDVSDAIKHAYMDEEIRKRMEEDNNC